MMDLGKARREALTKLIEFRAAEPAIEKFVLNQDLWGMLRVIAWLLPGADEERIKSRISELLAPCGRFWEGEIWVSNEKTSYADNRIYSSAWDEGLEVPEDSSIRIDDRTRTRTAWLPRFREPLWNAENGWGRNRGYAELNEEDAQDKDAQTAAGPPIVVFYSFKGGVGRTTALAAFAIRRARAGERVLVLDMDLDAPGAGMLLEPDEPSTNPGIVDYLLDAAMGEVDIKQYVHHCRRQQLVGDEGGEIIVLPAGRLDEDYLAKLARLDLEVRGEYHPLEHVLASARRRLQPDWILIDSRAGMSPAAGLLLDGIAHLHVLLGTNSIQSQMGLTQVLRNLGIQRIERGRSQANCLVMHAMVVDNADVEKEARKKFQEWLGGAMEAHYFIAEGQADADDWSVREMGEPDAPDQAIAIPYRQRFAFFSKIEDVLPDLLEGPHEKLDRRVCLQYPITE